MAAPRCRRSLRAEWSTGALSKLKPDDDDFEPVHVASLPVNCLLGGAALAALTHRTFEHFSSTQRAANGMVGAFAGQGGDGLVLL
jgi:hypothetical protein